MAKVLMKVGAFFDLRGCFINANAVRRVFLLTISPKRQRVRRPTVLAIQPFGDELNKTRRSFAHLGRLLADKGWSLAFVDLNGTGDSEGELSSVRMDDWVNDVITAYQFLQEQENCDVVRLLAVRLGALVALQHRVLASVWPDLVVLWEPITDGRRAIRQFLRVKVAADRFRGVQTSVDALLATAHKRGVLEVGGYQLSAQFIQELLNNAVDVEEIAKTLPIRVLTVAKTAFKRAEPRFADSCLAVSEIPGTRFWESVEIVVAHDFIQHTARYFPALD
jgi:exosortase A-associated hydrolase 2